MAFNIGASIHYAYFSVVLPLMFSLAFIVFIWGVFQYFIAGGHDEEAKEKGKSLMFYGLIVLALMAVMWGIGSWIAGFAGAA